MSLRDYSLKMTEQEYHDYPCWSHSLIARYATKGFSAVSTIHDKMEPTPAMEFGSLLDCMLTRPEDFDNEYVVIDNEVPAAEKNAIEALIAANPKIKSLREWTLEEIKDITDKAGYQSRWGAQTKFDHLIPYNDYYEKKASGLKAVSWSDFDDARKMKSKIWESDCTRDLFKTHDTQTKEYIYQAKFKIKYETSLGPVEIKIMPDLIIVDHENRTVQIIDLKTSAQPAYDFLENFLRFRYDIEASVYTYVLRQIMNNTEYRDYELLPFIFADISRSDMVPVTYVYDCTSESQCNGLSFGKDKVYTYKNWPQLLEEIMSYEQSNAVVPSNIDTTAPNDIVYLLNNR